MNIFIETLLPNNEIIVKRNSVEKSIKQNRCVFESFLDKSTTFVTSVLVCIYTILVLRALLIFGRKVILVYKTSE